MVPLSRQLHDIYEINTAVYLNRLSQQSGKRVTLAKIPDEELDRIAGYGCDAVWLMGIWRRSSLSVSITLSDTRFMDELLRILPDATADDVIGSAYSIAEYRVHEAFGDETQLAALRQRLAMRGMKLILDFVPNHSAFDHSWVGSSPGYYIHGRLRDKLRHPAWYRHRGTKLIACGRDPQFAPWSDVAQLNAFSGAYRQASIETLRHIASLCDGVRCDMAMLMTNDIFSKTWGKRAGTRPATEYWQQVISAVQQQAPDFIFIAECYWDTQALLVDQGFDYCYDKDIYDHLATNHIAKANERTAQTSAIAPHLLHFLENHDEPRAATVFEADAHRAAIRYIRGLAGPRLWHDRQFEGYRVKLPVHLGRGPKEPVNPEILAIYDEVLRRR